MDEDGAHGSVARVMITVHCRQDFLLANETLRVRLIRCELKDGFQSDRPADQISNAELIFL